MRLTRELDLPRLGHLTMAWGIFFAIVHAYWAAGGQAGMNGEPADTAPAQIYIAVIALLGLVGAAVADGLVHERTGPLGRWTLTVLARTGGVALIVGVATGVARWLTEGGVEEDGVAGVAVTLYFLLGGVLFSALGWRRGTR